MARTAARMLYEDDPYLWSQAQAELLRAQRFAELDLANLIEEVEDLGQSLKRSVRSRAIAIMERLLKLRHWPRSEYRLAWREAMRSERSELVLELTPSLRRELESERAELYARARHDAEASLRDHGEHAAADSLPVACPYGVEQIEGDWLP
jgi:Domain of unknown function DUF29